MRLLLVQRREAIRAMLLEKENITINEVMEKFHISVETKNGRPPCRRSSFWTVCFRRERRDLPGGL